jgi:hypothetical protein
MKPVVLYYAAGRTAARLIEMIKKQNQETILMEIKPENEHSIYFWFILSLFPWSSVKVKKMELGNADIFYLIVPKWNMCCPPVNGFIKMHNIKGKKFFVFVTYNKGRTSGYIKRIVSLLQKKGADVVGYTSVSRNEIVSDVSIERFSRLINEVKLL